MAGLWYCCYALLYAVALAALPGAVLTGLYVLYHRIFLSFISFGPSMSHRQPWPQRVASPANWSATWEGVLKTKRILIIHKPSRNAQQWLCTLRPRPTIFRGGVSKYLRWMKSPAISMKSQTRRVHISGDFNTF